MRSQMEPLSIAAIAAGFWAYGQDIRWVEQL